MEVQICQNIFLFWLEVIEPIIKKYKDVKKN